MNTSETYKTLEIQLSSSILERLENFKNAREISFNEALICLLLRGFTDLEEGTTQSGMENDACDYCSMYMQNEAELGVLCYKIFTQLESNRNWSLSTGAIENENTALKGVVNRLREEIALLQSELNNLQETK